MTAIDRSHYKGREYSLEEIWDKNLHIVFALSPLHSIIYCDEDQSRVQYVTKLAIVIDVDHRVEGLRQHLELRFYRPRHRIVYSSYGDIHLPGEEVILIPLYRVTFEQEDLPVHRVEVKEHPYHGQREDDRSQAGAGSGSEGRQAEEVSGGQQT